MKNNNNSSMSLKNNCNSYNSINASSNQLFDNNKNGNYIDNEYLSDNEDIDIEEITTNKIPKNINIKTNKKLYIVLEHANLELSSGSKFGSKIINSEDTKLLKIKKKSKEEYRPDVTHHCLLSLMDSPLNKSGLLQVYIKTKNNILIEINPKCRIPRTYNRFEGLMTVLLQKLKIRAKENSEVLLKVIKNPITDHIPLGSLIVSTNEKSRLVDKDDFALNCTKDYKNIVFVVGAISKGDVKIDYNHDSVSISSYPLSAGVVCSKICDSFEKAWGII